MSEPSRSRPWWVPRLAWNHAFRAGRRYEQGRYQEPWQVKRYRKADSLLRKVWDLHGTPITHDRPGFGGVGRNFWCSHCSMAWPCETARLVMNWGEMEERDYEPLRLVERRKALDDLRVDEYDELFDYSDENPPASGDPGASS